MNRPEEPTPPAPSGRQWPYWAAIAVLAAAVLVLALG